MSGISTNSKAAHWTGYVMSILPSLFLIIDGVMKLFKPAVVVEATTKLGYQESVIVPLGIVLVICTVLYLAGHVHARSDSLDRVSWWCSCYTR